MKRQNFILAICLIAGTLIAARLDANEGLNALLNTGASSGSAMTPADLEAAVNELPKENLEQINERAWRFDVQVDDYTLPTAVSISESGTHLWASYNLARLPDKVDPAVAMNKLLELMAQNGSYGDYFFSVIDNNSLLTIHGAIQLKGKVNTEELAAHLIRMADIAIEFEPLWNASMWDKDTPAHVGAWRANDHNMNLTLNASGQFELVAGDNNTTVGEFEIQGDTIRLAENNGDTLECTIRFDNANQFSLIINGHEIPFVRQ